MIGPADQRGGPVFLSRVGWFVIVGSSAMELAALVPPLWSGTIVPFYTLLMDWVGLGVIVWLVFPRRGAATALFPSLNVRCRASRSRWDWLGRFPSYRDPYQAMAMPPSSDRLWDRSPPAL
jgi:hypothetical protein